MSESATTLDAPQLSRQFLFGYSTKDVDRLVSEARDLIYQAQQDRQETRDTCDELMAAVKNSAVIDFLRIRLSALVNGPQQATLAIVLRERSEEERARLLSFLPAQDAVGLLQHLPLPEQVTAVDHMSTAQRVSSGELCDLAISVLDQCVSERSNNQTLGGEAFVGEMMQDPESRWSAIAQAWGEQHPAKVAAVRPHVLEIDDLLKWDNRRIQTLLKNTSSHHWVIFLATAREAFHDLFFNNVSLRTGEMLREDIEIVGTPSSKELLDAKRAILQAAQITRDKLGSPVGPDERH